MQFLEVEGNTIVGPREYLTFFYLGNHEVKKPGEYKCFNPKNEVGRARSPYVF